MPRRFERHARSKSDWGFPPARSAERASAATDPDKRAPARKDTRQWCKGKPGREHVPEIVFRPPWTRRPLACEWSVAWTDGARWECWHQEECRKCGKVLRSQPGPEECPAWPGSASQKMQAEAEARVALERRAAYRRERRPVITGPQGYRRQRQEAS